MATIVTRSGKGSALTHIEMDANFNNLNSDKPDLIGAPSSGNIPIFTGTANSLTDGGYSFSGLIGDTAVTKAEMDILDGAVLSTAALNYNDITTLGTAEASKTMTLDASKGISGITSLTSTTLSGTTVSGTTVNASTTLQIGGVSITASPPEINYSVGVTSSIQTQLDSKLTTPVSYSDMSFSNNIVAGDIATGAIGSPELAADSVGDSELKNSVGSSGSVAMASSGTWTPSSGFYNILDLDSGSGAIVLEFFISSAWRTGKPNFSGLFFTDGTNMRVKNTAGSSGTLYYQKLG